MSRFLFTTLINAVGLWVVTLLIPAIKLQPYGGDNIWAKIGSFILVSAIFGAVNALISPIIKVVAFPIYLLTFGLIGIVINGAMLIFVAWLSSLIGNQVFTIEGFTKEGLSMPSLGWAILGGLIMSISSMIAKSVSKRRG
jgi:putative membrane protein